jgi:basic amino acid/polyamine antiporter, APA family
MPPSLTWARRRQLMPETLVESGDPWGERLPRTIGLLEAVAVLVGITIGSGIFRVPATVAAQLHFPGPMLLCWLLGGVIALFGALTVAELAGALPRSGGIFEWLLESFGPLPAFLFGWTELAVIRAASLGATSTIFAEYLGHFIPLTAMQVRYVAAVVLLLIGAINYLGVKRAAAVTSVATIAKYAAVMVLGLLAFTVSTSGASHFTPAWDGGVHLSLIATALIPVMWTYDGWADLAFMGGEVKNPQRTLPLALILGTACVMLVYLVVNVGFMYVLTLPQMAHSKLIAATVAEHIPLFGGIGAAVISGIVLLSTFSGLNATMMTGPRIFFAMAERRLFFRVVARVSPRFETPSVAIWLATLLGVAYVLLNDFAQLADKFVLGIWPFYALCVAGVFVLRRKRPDLRRPYRVWGYPMVPLLFLVASVAMVANALWTDPANTGVTLLIILVGVPLFYLWKYTQKVREA